MGRENGLEREERSGAGGRDSSSELGGRLLTHFDETNQMSLHFHDETAALSHTAQHE